MMDNSGNKRDRSPEAEARCKDRNIVMDFTGWTGLQRSLAGYKPNTIAQKKQKRGWAAKHRRAPFADFLQPDKMELARKRHIHPRHLRAVA